jgi:hypothetical protein
MNRKIKLFRLKLKEMFSQGLNPFQWLGIVSKGKFVLSSYQVHSEEDPAQDVSKIQSINQTDYDLEWSNSAWPSYADLKNRDKSQQIRAYHFPEDLHNYLGQPIMYTKYLRCLIRYTLKDYRGWGIIPPQDKDILVMAGMVVPLTMICAFLNG